MRGSTRRKRERRSAILRDRRWPGRLRGLYCHFHIPVGHWWRQVWRFARRGVFLVLVGCVAEDGQRELGFPAGQDGYQLERAHGSRLRGEAANAAANVVTAPLQLPFCYRREAQGVAETAQSVAFGLTRALDPRVLAASRGEDPPPRDESQIPGP